MTTTTECVHHFIVPSPEKEREPIGVCKKCGAERLMANSVEISYWRNVKGERPRRKR